MSMLDLHTSKLMAVFRAKGGNLEVRLWAILKNADGDSLSQDLATWMMKIRVTKNIVSEEPEDTGIVIEGVKVLSGLGSGPRACCILVDLMYALDLAYAKELKFTFEAF